MKGFIKQAVLALGCAAAFVSRPGKVLDPLAPAPDVVGPDLEAVAAGIVAAEGYDGVPR